jgi:endonuclease III
MNEQAQQIRQVSALLLANRKGTEDWGEISHLDGTPCPKKVANKFLLCCLLDYQMHACTAWENGCRLVEKVLGDPDDVWKVITSVSETEWAAKWSEYGVHRFPAGHNRLWQIGKEICKRFDGDARRIWEGRDSRYVRQMLVVFGAGEQISRMIVGALRDCGQIKGASDVKADSKVCRVLGRVMFGAPTDPDTAGKLARLLYPTDPWQLDWPLWNVAKDYCDATRPACSRCYLHSHCEYARRH